MLLVMIPVVGMALGSVIARSRVALEGQNLDAGAGQADLVVPHSADQTDDLARLVGADGRLVTALLTDTSIGGTNRDGLPERRFVQFSDAPIGDPIFEGAFDIDNGRPPSTSTEVFVSRDVARLFDVGVGDQLVLDQPDVAWTVTGVGRSTAGYSRSFVIVGELDRASITPAHRTLISLVDLAPSVTVDDERALLDDLASRQLFGASRRFDPASAGADASDARELAWGWVAGVVSLIAVGIIISAAFATSARRQLTTVGQLSANGASERVIRRTLGLQGSWTGLLGAIAGVGVGLGIVLTSWPLIEEVFNHRIPDTRVVPLDLLVIVMTATVAATVAALVPARSAARVPVLAALAGRRPLADPPQWMAPVGLASFVVGLLMLVTAANSGNGGDSAALVAVVGALGVLFGMVCASPLIVHCVGVVGSRTRGNVRLAARSLARTRTRSAAVITAIATVMAIAVAGLTAVGSERSTPSTPDFPLHRVTLTVIDAFGEEPIAEGAMFDRAAVEPDPLPTALRTQIESILPDAVWTEVQTLVFDPAPFSATDPSPFGDGIVVATPEVLALLDLSPTEAARLSATGATVLAPGWTVVIRAEVGGRVKVFDLGTGDEPPAGAFELWDPASLPASAVVTPEWVADAGLGRATTMWVVDKPHTLTDAERSALAVVTDRFSPWAPESAFLSDQAPGGADATATPGSPRFWHAAWYWPSSAPPWVLINAIVLAVALTMVLMVVAIGLALSATEGRAERDVLHAVGAPPATLRRLGAAKAWVLTTAAAAIAVPTGFLVLAVISRSLDRPAPFPWIAASTLLFVVPLVAAASTWLVSGVGQRFRPVTASAMSAA